MYTVNTLLQAIVNEGRWNIDFAEGYAEPGYNTPQRGILFADWNDETRRRVG